MTITVWGAGTGRTIRVHWALAELGVDTTTKSPEFRMTITVLVGHRERGHPGDKHGGLPGRATTSGCRSS